MTDTLTSDTVDAQHDPFGAQMGDLAPNRCEVCGNGFEVNPGPGRKSKKCPDCRTSRSAGKTDTAGTANAAASSATAKKLENSINAMGAMSVLLLSSRSPSDAVILTRKVPPLAKTMGVWGAENKTVKKYIEGGANSLAAVGVLFSLFDLVWSLLANHGIVPGGPTPRPNLTVVPQAAAGGYSPFTTEQGGS